ENTECVAHYGRTPTEVLHDAGILGRTTTAIHATHTTDTDVHTLGRTGTRVCFCPTTEADLGDGIGPARELVDAGAVLCLGSDSCAVIDAFGEARALEWGQRLASRSRGRFGMEELLMAG